MSDIDPSDEGEQQINISDYRASQKRAAELERQLAEQTKANQLKDVEYAAMTAGVPTGTGAGKAFVSTYQGDNTPEAIRAAALEFGIFKPEGSDAAPATPATQAQVESDRQILQNSGSPPDPGAEPPPRHPGEEGLEKFNERMRGKGDTRERAAAEVINRITVAAIHGDERVLVRPWTNDELGKES